MAFQNGPVDRTTNGTSKGVDKDDLVMPVSKQKPPMRIVCQMLSTGQLIDFSAFLHGSSPTKLATAQSISHAFKDSGFLYLQNHGIPTDTISNVFQKSAEFFRRPQHEKDTLSWTTPESN